MAREDIHAPKTFSELLERGRQEVPPAVDVRAKVRQALAQYSDQPTLNWVDILLHFTALPRIRTGFSLAIITLAVTATMELSRPEAVPQPPMPHFLIDRLFQP